MKRLPETMNAPLAFLTSKKGTPASMLISSSPRRTRRTAFRRYRLKWRKSRRSPLPPSQATNLIRSRSRPTSTLPPFTISRNILRFAWSTASSSLKRTSRWMITELLLPNYGKLLKIQMFPPKRFCTISWVRRTSTQSLSPAWRNTGSWRSTRATTPRRWGRPAFTSRTKPWDKYPRVNLRSILTVKSWRTRRSSKDTWPSSSRS